METIVERVMQILPNQKPVIIAVSGMNGSGYEAEARKLQAELVKQGLLVHFEEIHEEAVNIDSLNPARSWYDQSMPEKKVSVLVNQAKSHLEWDIVIASGPFLLKNTLHYLYDTAIWVERRDQAASKREEKANAEWKSEAQQIHEMVDEPKQKANLVISN
ncbi:hypothetical protein ACQCVE_17330 [Metabacillus sp. 113a]|uniref:hypothetical protein n=1 Tax=Metabacillus sp. 113a TaxID=3404706 RepID=UPI003CE70777